MNEKRVQSFYKWLLKIQNIYLIDNAQVTRAFNKIYNYEQR